MNFSGAADKIKTIGGEYEENFAAALDRYVEEYQKSIKSLEIASGVSDRQIYNLRNGLSKPSFESIVALSIGLKLSYNRFEHLMHTAGVCFDNSSRGIMLRTFVSIAPFSDLTVLKCNFILRENGFEPLTKCKE